MTQEERLPWCVPSFTLFECASPPWWHGFIAYREICMQHMHGGLTGEQDEQIHLRSLAKYGWFQALVTCLDQGHRVRLGFPPLLSTVNITSECLTEASAALKIQTGWNGFQCWSFSRLWFNCSVRKARTGLNSRTKKSKFGAGELAHFYLVFKTLTFSSISYCCFEAVQRHLIILRLFHHYS